jgi:hypothetical protein
MISSVFTGGLSGVCIGFYNRERQNRRLDSEHFRITPRTGNGFGSTVMAMPTGNVGKTHAARSTQSSRFHQPFGRHGERVAARGARATD